RGILALGVLGAPGAESYLGELLLRSPRGAPEAMAAALALGLLPDDVPTPAVDEYVREVRGSSYRLQRDTLSALLYGLGEAAHPSRMGGVAEVLDDVSNRELGVRCLALRALARVPDALAAADVPRWLRSDYAEERAAALAALAATGHAPDAATVALVEQL